MGQAPSSQVMRVQAKVRGGGTPRVAEVDPLSFSLPAIHEQSSIYELLKEGYKDQGRGAGQFEGLPEGHALLTFDPPRVKCAELPAAGVLRVEDGMRQAVQAVNSFMSVCADLHGWLALAERKAASEANKAREAEAWLQALEEERRRLEEDVTRPRGELEGTELTHSLQMESLLATNVPKSRLDAYIRAGIQRYLGSSDFALGINDIMDPTIERGARKVVMEIEAAQRKNEDIQPLLDKYVGREMKGKTSATPPRTPPGPDENSEIVASAPPPPGHKSGSHGGGGTSTDFSANSGDKDAASEFPPQPEGTSRGVPTTPGSGLVDPNVDRSRGRLSGLEGQLEEALEAFRASELHEARRAVIEAKVDNDRLDRLWRDMETYWEDHLKNSIQLEILANNRLRTFEAKIRKKNKDEGLAKPDPEDFIPRNYFESVLVHLWKAYALVAVKWDRSSDKIEAFRAYAGQLRAALEGAISFIVETGKVYDFEACGPNPIRPCGTTRLLQLAKPNA
ncbi:OLC1v1016103C1 [Oldenlandia corymbosa var. corymbosa]|uniref:OLC1v1016103C1 n=1 Tax=Oldenlandia corymbosa var. corymbosa TaxID=529605 RepID=A0AAV1E4Y7_OLDCO|nr:OLC1v1016103C1 [Oldenlandia corymbosa var. corymbosa]